MVAFPDWRPRCTEIPAPPEFIPASWALESAYPPVQKLADGALAVDWWRLQDGGIMVKRFENVDHPNIASLPKNAPRAVRQVFRREFQLRLLRMSNCSAVEDLERAWDAWDCYWHQTA